MDFFRDQLHDFISNKFHDFIDVLGLTCLLNH